MRRPRTHRYTLRALGLVLTSLGTACGDDANGLDGNGTDSQVGESGETDGTHQPTGTNGDTWEEGSLEALSDDFDDPASLQAWTRREQVDGEPAHWNVLEIEGGRLRLRPTASGWYANYVGPMLFKQVSGNFIVETSVRAASARDPETAPSQLFNAGGLIVRDPSSSDGTQNWITHNIGRQQPEVGTEGKSTRDSQSHLELHDGLHHGVLRICRVGQRFVLARRSGNEATLHETHRFDREDMPDTLQVGMMANGWNSADEHPDTSVVPDVEVTFDYVHFRHAESESDCLAP